MTTDELMAKMLDEIIASGELDEKDRRCAPAQVVFNPGAGQASGLLRKHKIDGLYVLAAVAQAKADVPNGPKAGDMAVVEQTFAAGAVQRVITQLEVEERRVILQQ